MRLFFTAIHKQTQLRSFSYQPETLEAALDFLNSVCAKGDVLLRAHVDDESSTVDLPVDIFDGEPFSEPMQALEKQWQALLVQPTTPAISQHTKELIELTKKRIQIHERLITHLERTISRLETLSYRAKAINVNRPASNLVLSHYESLIYNYKKQMHRVRTQQDLAIAKLHHLQRASL